jgi:hypothetical protein
VEAEDRLAYPGSVPERPVGAAPDLPPDVPPEYADAYLRGFQRAYAEAAGLGSAVPLPAQGAEPATPGDDDPAGDEQSEHSGEVDQPAEPWQYEPPAQSGEPEPTGTWAFEPPGADQDDTLAQPADVDAEEEERADTAGQDAVDPDALDPDAVDPYEGDESGPVVPGFVLWEGRDERYDEPPDVDGYPRWVMPFLAGCLIVLLFVAIYLLA